MSHVLGQTDTGFTAPSLPLLGLTGTDPDTSFMSFTETGYSHRLHTFFTSFTGNGRQSPCLLQFPDWEWQTQTPSFVFTGNAGHRSHASFTPSLRLTDDLPHSLPLLGLTGTDPYTSFTSFTRTDRHRVHDSFTSFPCIDRHRPHASFTSITQGWKAHTWCILNFLNWN